MKTKIAYISMFYDTDITVLKHLSSCYEVYVYIIYRKPCHFSIDYFKEYAKENNLILHIQEYNGRFRHLDYYKCAKKIFADISKKKCRLIYNCNTHIYFSLSYLLYARNVPQILGIHDVISHSDFEKGFFLRASKRISMHIPKCFITFSLYQYSVFKNRYKYDCYNVGMSYKDFGKCNIKISDKSETKILLFGSLLKYKGYEELILAINNIENKNKKIKVTIAGYPKDGADVFIRENAVSDLYDLKLDYISNDDIPRLFASHHFIVFPYRDVTQSGPLMIALNYSKPIIAPNYGCFNDIYTDSSAILYDKNNPMALQNAIIRAIDMDYSEYDKMVLATMNIKDKYSEENISSNYINVFNRILQK